MNSCPTAPRPADAAGTAIVVAHPDDEMLWFSGVLGAAGRVVLCYGDSFWRPAISAARRRAVASLPLAGLVALAIPESGARFMADWAAPRLTACGIAITEPAAAARYEANFPLLVERLRPLLAGRREVYTHNPWGEYGHSEHLQVHRAVTLLQAELGFTLWFSNYVGPRSWPLARMLANQVGWSARRSVAPDLALAHRLAQHYRRHGARTWPALHRWPGVETFYAQAPTRAAEQVPDAMPRQLFAGEVLCDVSRLRPWFPARLARRRLR